MINIGNLSRFVNIVINVNSKSKGKSKSIQRSFRNCKYKDFSERDYQIDK